MIEITNDLTSLSEAALARLIIAKHRLALDGLSNARDAGLLLHEAKRRWGQHGAWQAWVQRHCQEVALRTARLYMRIARLWPELVKRIVANGNAVADIPLRDAARILAKPRPVVTTVPVRYDQRVTHHPAPVFVRRPSVSIPDALAAVVADIREAQRDLPMLPEALTEELEGLLASMQAFRDKLASFLAKPQPMKHLTDTPTDKTVHKTVH